MNWPKPVPGLVIRYSYLWEAEAAKGREEGVKDRPCAVVLTLLREGETNPIVRVLPISHTPPIDPDEALELPAPTRSRLGLDDERSWVVLTEANDFIWPGPDLRPAVVGDLSSVAYGMLPPAFVTVLVTRIQALRKRKRHSSTTRSK